MSRRYGRANSYAEEPRTTEVQLVDRDDCIYAAGLFDGEGSAVLCVRYQKKRQYRSGVLCASISNTYLPVLPWLKERWGGTVALRKKKRAEHHKVSGTWNLTCPKAAAFLRDIEPHVKIKRGQVENALAFQDLRDSRRRRKITAAEWEASLTYLRRQRELNGHPQMVEPTRMTGTSGN